MDITTMTDIELKALAFDMIAQRDQAQTNINAIVTELQKRADLANTKKE